MRKALALALSFITAIAISSSCSRSYYHDAEVLSAYQRQARAMCLAANAKSKLSTCRRAKACASAAQAGLEAVLLYEQASAKMTATVDDRLAADAAYAGAVAACGVAGIGAEVTKAGSAIDAGASQDAGASYDAGMMPAKALAPLTDGGLKHG